MVIKKKSSKDPEQLIFSKLDSSADPALNEAPSRWRPREDLRTLEKRIGYRFIKRSILERALTPQRTHKNGGYQLLEYFGDGALRYVIPRILKERYPSSQEGELSRMYSAITCNTNLAFMSYRLKLPYYLRFSNKPSINRKLLADVVEAIIGAVDESGGLDAVTEVCKKIFKLDIEIARFHEPQDALLRFLRQEPYIKLLNQEYVLKGVKENPRVSYQAHVIQKKWGKLGHVSVLRLNGSITVATGEGYDAESANNNSAAIAILKLFPSRFGAWTSSYSWKLPP